MSIEAGLRRFHFSEDDQSLPWGHKALAPVWPSWLPELRSPSSSCCSLACGSPAAHLLLSLQTMGPPLQQCWAAGAGPAVAS